MSCKRGICLILSLLAIPLVAFGPWYASRSSRGPSGPSVREDRTATAAQRLESRFTAEVHPSLERYCFGCHGCDKPEADLDLRRDTTLAAIARNARQWNLVRQRLQAEEMPPEDAPRHPQPDERAAVLAWLRDFHDYQAQENAGDPGPVLALRLSNAEYDYTISKANHINRRTLLKGVGVTMALPWLESLSGWGREAASGAVATRYPQRFAALFMGNGISPKNWWAKGSGADMELSKSLQPLAPLRSRLNVITGLFNKHATGVGIHPGQTGNILSGAALQKGAVLHGGVSMDQVLAAHFEEETAQPSLVLGCEQPITGYHETNFSMAYSSHISWQNADSPVPMEVYPSLAFQTDKTRVTTLLLCRDLSGLFYPFLDVRTAHHPTSHEDQSDAYERVTRYYVSQLAYLAGWLAEMNEGETTVLDNSRLMFISNMWSGSQHDSSKFPVILVGGLGGKLTTGRVLDYLGHGDDSRRLCSLYLALMNRMGVQAERFGDATAPLAEL